MLRNGIRIVLTLLVSAQMALGQEGLNYQMTMISNPSVTGSTGDGVLRLSYMNHYPGNGFDLHSVNLSYDSYFPSLHGGVGLYLSDEYLSGIINNLKGGFSYSYHFRAAKDFFICAGLSASFYHRGYDLRGAVLPDQIDPLLGAVIPSAETVSSGGRTVLDLATGFLFVHGRFFGGFSVNHLTEPDPVKSDAAKERLDRVLLVHGAGEFGLGSTGQIRVVPMAGIEAGREIFAGSAGVSAENNHLAVNIVFLTDNKSNLDLQAGFSVKTGRLVLFYNYRFNIVSGDNFLPFSLLHHTGIAFSLNNVDKRKTVKTINFPNL